MDQTTMFTKEQMSGSGQTNMLDLIERNKKRIKELQRTPHTFHADPGHGWLEVQFSDLAVLDILGKISGYSYRSNGTVYLEEDMDAGTYINALFGDFETRNETQKYMFEHWKGMLTEKHTNNESFIRNLKSFK